MGSKLICKHDGPIILGMIIICVVISVVAKFVL